MSANTNHRVTVVIVNYNSGAFLKQAVSSTLTQSGVTPEVIIVDNASSDYSLELLGELKDRVSIIRNAKNLGFGKACNIGTSKASGEYTLFLNPDCVLHDGALCKLVNALRDNPDAALAGPMLLNEDGTEQSGGRRDIPSPWKTFCMLLRLDLLMPEHPRFKNFNHAGRAVPKEITPVDAISGACMLARSSALASNGGFDEEYFLHFEDLELCLRYGRNNQLILFVPNAICTHVKGRCSVSRPLFVEYHKHNSFVKFINRGFLRYYPNLFLFVVSFLVYMHFVGVSIKYIFSNRRKNILSAFWDRF